MIKPILGSWFEFQHSWPPEGPYWNDQCMAFTAQQWEQKIEEIADIGLEYLVLMSVALDGKTFYRSQHFEPYGLACEDGVEAIMRAADRCGIKFFVSNDFFGNWRDMPQMLRDPKVIARRRQAMEELTERFAHHPSFYGWYWPNESWIQGHFSDDFIQYVNTCSALAERLTPGKKTLIAPYGTNMVSADDRYLRQLEQLNVDVIAYQDEIGVRKTRIDQLEGYWERLRKMHDKVPQRQLWADVEIFEFEGEVYQSPLVPAAIDRVIQQLQIASDYVDLILVYQYQGIMNKPGSPAVAGRTEDTEVLYTDYVQWLRENWPQRLAGELAEDAGEPVGLGTQAPPAAS